MAEKICLDTDACIAILNNENRAESLTTIIANRTVFVTSITVFELHLRKINLDKVKNFLNDVFILYLDEASAIKASSIYKELKQKGKLLEFRDVFIASTALVNNCILATFNKKHFSIIPELELLNC